MRIIGKFKILDSFKINGRGLVAWGDILEGVVRNGSFVSFIADPRTITLRIRSVEFMDNVSKGESWVAFLFDYNSVDQMKEPEELKLTEQIVEVFDKD